MMMYKGIPSVQRLCALASSRMRRPPHLRRLASQRRGATSSDKHNRFVISTFLVVYFSYPCVFHFLQLATLFQFFAFLIYNNNILPFRLFSLLVLLEISLWLPFTFPRVSVNSLFEKTAQPNQEQAASKPQEKNTTRLM